MESSHKDYRRENQADGQSYFGQIRMFKAMRIFIRKAQLEAIFVGTASRTQAENIVIGFGHSIRLARLNDRCAWLFRTVRPTTWGG